MGWERLNAYVDRELDPADAAEVAAAVARDPDLAARVATLSRLKATTSALPPRQFPLPAPRPAARRAERWLVPLAAAALLIVSIATTLWWRQPGIGADAWLAPAVAAHQAWLSGDPGQEDGERIRIALEARAVADVPDLTEAKLSLVHVSVDPGSGRPGIFLGYQGIHGCQVGLWIGGAAPGIESRPTAVASGDLAGYAWRVDGAGYALLARGMNPERLAALADAVVRITNRRHQLDDGIRTALRGTIGLGRPCAV